MKGSLPIAVLLCSAGVSFAWDLKPDPPAEKPWALKADLAIPAVGRNDRVMFADGNGPFVLIGVGDGTAREVYDLRTGERVAAFDAGEPRRGTEQEYLSADGKTWAFPKPFGKEVKLIDTATGKPLPPLATDGPILGAVFVAPDRLLVLCTKTPDRVAQVFDTTTGKEKAKGPVEAGGFGVPGGMTRPLAASPGGKYLAALRPKSVILHRTADGVKAVDLELTALPAVSGKAPPPAGVAFSADGSELAVVFGKSDKGDGTLKVWKLADGTSTEHVIDRPDSLPGVSAPAVAPILSGGWLIDGTQVWVGGKVQRTVPKGFALYIPRLAVTPEQVVGLVEPPLTDIQKKPTVGLVATSGSASSPTKDGTLAGATEVPSDERVGWTGSFTPYAETVTPGARKMSVPRPVVGLTVSLDGRRGFIECDFGPRAEMAKRQVITIDFRTGVPNTLSLPEKRVLFGDTLTGEEFLTIGPVDANGSGERLELFSAEGKSLVAWRPHADLKSPNPFRSSIRYAAVLGPTRAVTVGNGRVTLWQLPEAKAVWTVRMPEAAGGVLSPDGKLLYVAHAGGVRAFMLVTGGTLGNLTGAGAGAAFTVAVSGDCKRLAVFDATAPNRAVRVWDLADGRLLTTLAPRTVEEAAAVRWLGSRYLLVGEQVFDTTDGREVWKMKPPSSGAVARSAPADGRLWYAGGAGGGHLVPAAFPADQLDRFVAGYDKTGDGLFQKGERVKVVIEAVDAPPGWDAQARTAARLALTTAKLTEDVNAAAVVRVTFTKVPATPVKLKWQGVENLGKEETINRFAVEARTEVTRNGQVVHTPTPVKTEMRIKDWPLVNEIDDDSKTGQEFFTRQVWKSASYSAGFVFAGAGAGIKQPNGLMWRLPGEATLTGEGLVMNWPPGEMPRAVDGDPSLNVQVPPTAPGSGWVAWAVGGVCGGVLLAGGVLALVLVLRAKQRTKSDAKRPRRRGEDDDRPRRRRRDDDDDDDDDRPRRVRRRRD